MKQNKTYKKAFDKKFEEADALYFGVFGSHFIKDTCPECGKPDDDIEGCETCHKLES